MVAVGTSYLSLDSSEDGRENVKLSDLNWLKL